MAGRDLTLPAYGLTGGHAWPPVFPYSLTGYPRLCKCQWTWNYNLDRFIKTYQADDCVSCALRRNMGKPINTPADALLPQPLMITRAQHNELSDIQAALVIERGRHVTLKDTFSTLVEFWKEHHHGNPA